MDHFDLSKYFTYISGAVKDVRITKEEVIKHALEYNNITNLDEVIMIGDRKYDVIGAKIHNLKSIAVLYGGYSTREEFLENKPTYLIEKPSEILDIILER